MAPFIKGINYWPAGKAMYWWKTFDSEEAAHDFGKLQVFHFNVVRIFLLWEDFQPQPDQISVMCLDQLKHLADLAEGMGLKLMPTFFCGHMSGVNWFPQWMLEPAAAAQRFPVFAEGQLKQAAIRNFFTEEAVLEAQLLQTGKVCTALSHHPAVYAYDLGNEPSNCVIPPDRSMGRNWLKHICGEIRRVDPDALITLGMHAEDLEEDRHLWPQDAALYCDFLCMHGYPFYLSWVSDPRDPDLVPFLGMITAWLGNKAVLLQEYGAPTQSAAAKTFESNASTAFQFWPEDALAEYYRKTLPVLQEAGLIGAMAWCFADYQPDLWQRPPLQDNLHERTFGLFRADGSAKKAAEIWRDFPAASLADAAVQVRLKHPAWLDGMDPGNFYGQPRENLICLFDRYKESLKGRNLK